MSNGQIDVRRLQPGDAGIYRALMLEAYERHPDAFTSSTAERAVLPLSWWEARVSTDPRAASWVFGAFVNGVLAGVAGLSFESRQKSRHKADFFGMYVAPADRQLGVGSRIVQAAVEAAVARPELRVLQLTVTEGNDAAERLYAQYGFQRFGVEPMAVALDGRYMSKVHMWLDLRPPGG
jgi:RimJ/RimL family protein N-acetyltransferase